MREWKQEPLSASGLKNGARPGGIVRIFTAKRSQNYIANNYGIAFVNSAINGNTYVAGPLFVDSATEKWGIYYPSFLGGDPYTIFYKDSKFVPPNIPALDPRFFYPNYELFYKPFYQYNLLHRSPYTPWPNILCEL